MGIMRSMGSMGIMSAGIEAEVRACFGAAAEAGGLEGRRRRDGRAGEAALPLHEVEFLFGGVEGFVADAGGFGRFGLAGGGGGAVIGAKFVQVAFDAAFGEADHGVDEAGELVHVGEETFAEGGGVGVGEELAKICRDDVDDGAAGLVGIARGGDDGLSKFVLCLESFDELAGAEPVEVATGFPVGKVLFVEALGFGTEALDDFEVGNTVEEHEVEFFAGGDGEAGDFAGAGHKFLNFEF